MDTKPLEVGDWVRVVYAGYEDWDDAWDNMIGKLVDIEPDTKYPFHIDFLDDAEPSQFKWDEIQNVTDEEVALYIMSN